MALEGDNIGVQVYKNLISAVEEYLPVLHKYYEIRRKLLNLDKVHMYDVYVPLVSEIDKKVPYDEAKETVINAMKPLGDKYCNILKKGFI